jgi:hypothetical protein
MLSISNVSANIAVAIFRVNVVQALSEKHSVGPKWSIMKRWRKINFGLKNCTYESHLDKKCNNFFLKLWKRGVE